MTGCAISKRVLATALPPFYRDSLHDGRIFQTCVSRIVIALLFFLRAHDERFATSRAARRLQFDDDGQRAFAVVAGRAFLVANLVDLVERGSEYAQNLIAFR